VKPTSAHDPRPLASSTLCGAALAAACAGALAACEPSGPAAGGAPSAHPSASAAPAAAAPVSVTVLYTADEHGWLLPGPEEGKTIGGAAELLGAWIANEKHCTGGPGTAKPCSAPSTIALSGGDSFTGPAISTLFLGEPMAEAMGKMGYAASVLGNHDLDFGRMQFVKNKKLAKVDYVGANVKVKDPEMNDLSMPPFVLVERKGVKVGVIGLASETTAARSMADRFSGLEFQAPEAALEKAVPDAWAAGADALVVIAHECPDKYVPIFAKHAEWKVSFVGGANCHKAFEDRSTGAIMIAPKGKLQQYARVELTIDKGRAARERVTSVAAKAVDAAGGAADPALAGAIAEWKKKVDAALGEEIGHTEKGLDQKADAGRWVAGAWKEELGVDVAIVNAKGIVQSVPAGAITKATVYSVMPYDNSLMVLEVSGADLAQSLDNPEAVYAGAKKDGKSYKVNGKALDPAGRYKVATVEYLYFGGDNFGFAKQDPAPKETGMDWRTPVIEWSLKQHSTKADPIEKKLK
jgi:2',3'-cyclic-nucleotide 2'-phosphodiesterase (5'-nucleotidase family)